MSKIVNIFLFEGERGRGSARGLLFDSMLPDAPDDLKFMLPYLQRASELKMKDPVMSYYCTFYAANIALKKGYPKNQVNDGFLMALLDELGAVYKS